MARPATKRKNIEDAAIFLFATKGLAATTIKDIASHAEVAEGALYRHYTSKMDMATKLFKREIELFSLKLGKILFAGEIAFEQRMEEAITYMYDYYCNHPVNFSFIMLTQHGFPRGQLPEIDHDPNEMAIRFVKMGIESGDVMEIDPEVLAALLMGAVLRPVVMHRRGKLNAEPRTLAPIVISTCARILLKKNRSPA